MSCNFIYTITYRWIFNFFFLVIIFFLLYTCNMYAQCLSTGRIRYKKSPIPPHPTHIHVSLWSFLRRWSLERLRSLCLSLYIDKYNHFTLEIGLLPRDRYMYNVVYTSVYIVMVVASYCIGFGLHEIPSRIPGKINKYVDVNE